MHPFTPVYIPVGVPTFHLESAQDQFERSIRVLKSIDEGFVCPEEMLLSLDKLRAYLDSAAAGSDRVPEPDLCQRRLHVRGAAPL